MADYQFIDSSGVIVPDTGDLLDTVEAEFRAVFGQDLVVEPSTPQGVLIAAEVASRDAVARNNAALANQINPNLAGGIFLDAIMALTDSARAAATRSVVVATLAGVPGTIIPAGSRAQTATGDIFELLATVVLGIGGTASGSFRAIEFGPIAVDIGALSQLVDGVLGWETVTNPAVATLGSLVMPDQAARELRRRTLGGQGSSVAVSITSALFAVEGVRSLSFRENVTNAAAVIDGVNLVEHSIYACVDGGSDLDVATALLEKKSAGSDWNGATTVNVLEAASGQTYEVKFARPVEIDILVRVTVRNTTSIPNPTAVVQDAILSYAAGGQEGEEGFIVGASVTTFELGGAVSRAAPGMYVKLVEISTDGLDWTPSEIVVGIDEVARTQSSSISVILL